MIKALVYAIILSSVIRSMHIIRVLLRTQWNVLCYLQWCRNSIKHLLGA